MYIAARNQWNVYLVPHGSTTGTIFAGTSTPTTPTATGPNGDGGLALACTFDTFLFSVAYDPSTGNLLVSDTNKARLITAGTGIITTILSQGSGAFLAGEVSYLSSNPLVNISANVARSSVVQIISGTPVPYIGTGSNSGSLMDKIPPLTWNIQGWVRMCVTPQGSVALLHMPLTVLPPSS